jgi:hypothetical protein
MHANPNCAISDLNEKRFKKKEFPNSLSTLTDLFELALFFFYFSAFYCNVMQ